MEVGSVFEILTGKGPLAKPICRKEDSSNSYCECDLQKMDKKFQERIL